MKNLNTPLVSIFCDNTDYFIPVVELDFFNRKGLHSHFKEDLKEWNIKKDYEELENRFKEELSWAKNEKTRQSVIRKFTSTIPIEDSSKIPKFFKLDKNNYDIKYITFNKLEFNENLQSESVYQKLKKIAVRDKILDDLNLDLSKVIDYGNVLGFITNEELPSYEIRDVEVNDLDLKLINAEYLIKSNGNVKDSVYFKETDTSFIFKNSKKEIIEFVNDNNKHELTIYKLNNTSFIELASEIDNEKVSFDFEIIPKAIPNINSKKIDNLSKLSKTNEIGILKFKIDNLDDLISDLDSTEELLAFTFYLELFMAGRINQIINKFKLYSEDYGLEDSFEENKLDDDTIIFKPISKLPKQYRDLGFPSIHILHSSGDTLIAQGPKEDIIKFLKEFEVRFGKWTAFSNKFSLSASINSDQIVENNVLIDNEKISWQDLDEFQ